jgi:hypothetical protein
MRFIKTLDILAPAIPGGERRGVLVIVHAVEAHAEASQAPHDPQSSDPAIQDKDGSFISSLVHGYHLA